MSTSWSLQKLGLPTAMTALFGMSASPRRGSPPRRGPLGGVTVRTDEPQPGLVSHGAHEAGRQNHVLREKPRCPPSSSSRPSLRGGGTPHQTPGSSHLGPRPEAGPRCAWKRRRRGECRVTASPGAGVAASGLGGGDATRTGKLAACHALLPRTPLPHAGLLAQPACDSALSTAPQRPRTRGHRGSGRSVTGAGV